jgi:hypothetical protein
MATPQSHPTTETKRHTNEEDLKEQASFVARVHDYLCDFIKFADQKGAFIFAGASGFLALVFNQGGRAVWRVPIASWRLHEWLAGATIIVTVASATLAALAIAPRLKDGHRGLIYWNSISSFANWQEYRAALAKLDLRGTTDEMSHHCYELSRLAKRKYELLKWAMWAGITGLAVGGLWLLFF